MHGHAICSLLWHGASMQSEDNDTEQDDRCDGPVDTGRPGRRRLPPALLRSNCSKMRRRKGFKVYGR